MGFGVRRPEPEVRSLHKGITESRQYPGLVFFVPGWRLFPGSQKP